MGRFPAYDPYPHRDHLITFSAGLEVPINKHVSIGAIYELPLTDHQDMFDQRVTAALNVEY